jgi:hypothetical protein
MKKIKIHTEETDNYRQVIGLDLSDNVAIMQYGELGYPNPYIVVEEVGAALEVADLTYDDRFRYIQDNQLSIDYMYDLDGELDYIHVSNRAGATLCGEVERLDDLREVIDYLIDMDEENPLA